MGRNQLKSIGAKRKLRMTNMTQYDVNYSIRCPQVRLVLSDGTTSGIVDTKKALSIALSEDLDLVVINAVTSPPIARICNYEKFIYEQKRHKKEQDRKLRENAIHVKEIQLRPGISSHDFEVKLQHAKAWLDDNCKIKIVVKFRGREITFKAKGFNIINNFVDRLGCKIEKSPDMNSNVLIAMVGPNPK